MSRHDVNMTFAVINGPRIHSFIMISSLNWSVLQETQAALIWLQTYFIALLYLHGR